MASYRLRWTYGGKIVVDPNSSSSSSCSGGGTVAFLFHLPKPFPLIVPEGPGGSSCNLTEGINGLCLSSFRVVGCDGTYRVVSSMVIVGDAIAIPDFVVVLVLEIEITMLRKKLSSSLAVENNNFSLECSWIN